MNVGAALNAAVVETGAEVGVPSINVHGRDIVLIAPCTKAGSGDYASANKISNIALEQGCRVSVVFVAAEEGGVEISRKNYSCTGGLHDIGELSEPLFIVSPVGILNASDLKTVIEGICTQHGFGKNDAILIEELDVFGGAVSLQSRTACLQALGFSSVQPCQLGFGEGAVGYLPVSKGELSAIRSRFENELRLLLDSLNFSLDKHSSQHLAYISSNLCLTASQVFLFNTLSESRHEACDSNYVMVMRMLGERGAKELEKTLLEATADFLGTSNEHMDCSSLFGQAHIYVVDETGTSVNAVSRIEGTGVRKLNIVFVDALPHNIFQDFICLSTSGMGSGDQSLGEFLSITASMPYYDMPHWKYPFFYSVKEVSRSFGGEELERWVSARVVGRMPIVGKVIYQLDGNSLQGAYTPEFMANKRAFNQALSNRKADGHIRRLLDQARSFV